ncbi:MAG: Glycosyl transferase family 2 [Syntrophaceae bacterium PtaB.Bin038]|nr:MAG: Glycosyl transferase family 2 [Syntrophaceae bacterium PtaB.Bin038]
MGQRVKIAAVIVTFNNPGMLRDLLEDLLRQSLRPHRVVIVDNSTRRGANYPPLPAPKIETVQMAANEGSAGGFHEGLRRALEGGSDAILTLDDDVRMPADALEALYRGLRDLEEREGCVGAVRAVGPNHPDPAPTPIACFAWRGTLMRAEAARQAGLPRKDYFLYADDAEYALRMAACGWRFFWVPGSLIVETRKDDKQTLRVLGREVSCYAEAYRFYYAVRNSIHAFRMHGRRAELRSTLAYAVKMALLLSFVRTGERGRAKAILLGVHDGFRSRLGKRAEYHPAETPAERVLRPSEARR